MAKKDAAADDKFIFGKTFNTVPGRLMFPQIAQAKAYKDNKPKWSSGIVVRPLPRIIEIIDEIELVGLKAFGEKWQKKPDLFMKPYMTGEAVIEKIEEKGKKVSEKSVALYNGHTWLTANANTENRKGQLLEAPNCYLADGSKLPRRPGNTDDLKAIEATYYAGSWCRLAVTPMSYETGRSLGVKLILKGIQFIKDGDRLGGENIDALMGEEIDESYEFETDETSASFTSDAVDDANI